MSTGPDKDDKPAGLLRKLWRVVNSPVLGPFLLAILFAAVSYYFIFNK